MPEITDDEVAEVLWASSDEGKAALRAAWDKFRRLNPSGVRPIDMADIGAIIYAAHVAAVAAGAGEPS